MTQHPAITWTDSTIKMMTRDGQNRTTSTSAGLVTEKTMTGYVGSTVTVSHLDRITYREEIYEVSATPTIEYHLGVASFIKLELVMIN